MSEPLKGVVQTIQRAELAALLRAVQDAGEAERIVGSEPLVLWGSAPGYRFYYRGVSLALIGSEPLVLWGSAQK